MTITLIVILLGESCDCRMKIFQLESSRSLARQNYTLNLSTHSFKIDFFTFFISTHLPTFALVRLVACAARLDIFLAWACYIVYVYLVEMLIVVEPATHSLAFLSSLLHKLGLPFKVQQSLADCFFSAALPSWT